MNTTDTQTQAPKLNVPKVSNMTGRSGPVANQFLIRTEDGVAFQSYDSVIAFKQYGGPVFLDRYYWDYSVTTGRYRNQFLGLNKKETQEAIDEGRFILTDLNK